jgi:serine/threonine protein kinase
VVVLDFGLAVDAELGGMGQTIADDSVSGTPGYMAPEQAAGKPATQASDFYALGVMLFEALTGKLPFEGRVGEMLAAKQRDQAPRASTLASSVPTDLDVLCAELLSREPSSRPDATELRARLGGSESIAQRLSRSIAAPLAQSCWAATQSSRRCAMRTPPRARDRSR